MGVDKSDGVHGRGADEHFLWQRGERAVLMGGGDWAGEARGTFTKDAGVAYGRGKGYCVEGAVPATSGAGDYQGDHYEFGGKSNARCGVETDGRLV